MLGIEGAEVDVGLTGMWKAEEDLGNMYSGLTWI